MTNVVKKMPVAGTDELKMEMIEVGLSARGPMDCGSKIWVGGLESLR
jgi:hypothetical protein